MTSCLMSSKNAELCVDRADNEFLEEPNLGVMGVGGCSSISDPGLAYNALGFSIVRFAGLSFFSAGAFALKYPPIPILMVTLLPYAQLLY